MTPSGTQFADFTYRVGQARDLLQTFDHGIDARLVELETFQHRRTQLVLARGCHIPLVFFEDEVTPLVQHRRDLE
jgi:aromatic ring-opening dioxygenase LigB subunit